MPMTEEAKNRRTLRRFNRRRRRAEARGCTCGWPLDLLDPAFGYLDRMRAEHCPFHRGKN